MRLVTASCSAVVMELVQRAFFGGNVDLSWIDVATCSAFHGDGLQDT
jgi:hypothetical protein